jgi:hypothetical protein
MTGKPEIVIQFLQFLAAQISEAMSEDFLAGTIQEQDAPRQVRGDQATAHGVNDVFGEVLKAEKFLPLLFKLHAFLPQRLSQEAGQIDHGNKTQEIHYQPGTKTLGRREGGECARNLLGVSQHGHAHEQQETGRRRQEGNLPREQNARDDNHQEVEGDKIAFLQAGGINQERNHQHIAGDLKTTMPTRVREPSQEDEVQDSEGDPEDNQGQKETVGTEARNILRPNHADRKDERDRQETNARQPVQPFPCGEALIHCTPTPSAGHPQSPGRNSGGRGIFSPSSIKWTMPSGRQLD